MIILLYYIILMVFKTVLKDIMLWGEKKATKKDLNKFIKEEDIEDYIKEDDKEIEKNIKKVEKKKTEYIEGENYSIEDIDMLDHEYEKLDEIIGKLYDEMKDEEASELEDKQEKIGNLIEGLKAFKKMSGKGFKKGSPEAIAQGKKMAEARKAKAKPKPKEELKEVKKAKKKPYFFIDKPPKGYREATEEEAIKAGKVGTLGIYVVDNTRYDMYLKYKVLISDKTDEGEIKTNQNLLSNMNGLKTRINKLLKNVEIEKNKKELNKNNNYEELADELKMVNKAYNWYNKLYSNNNDIPYVNQKFKLEKPQIKTTKSKELKAYIKPETIDPRTGRPVEKYISEDDDVYFFENSDGNFSLSKKYFDNKIIKDSYAKKLLNKKIILMPEYYTEEMKNKIFGKIVGSGIFSLNNLKKAFTGFIPFSMISNKVVPELDDEVGKYPKYVSEIIKKNGKYNIVKLDVGRAPIVSVIGKLLNAMTLGKLEKRMERKGYDDLFHLWIEITLSNGKKIKVEKNERINMEVNPKRRKDGEYIDIDIDKELTFDDLLEGGKRIQGDKYFKYSGHSNNCQDYILALLEGSDLGDENDHLFVKQDIEALFRHYGLVQKIQDKTTNFAGKLNRLIYGGGIKRRREYKGSKKRPVKRRRLEIIIRKPTEYNRFKSGNNASLNQLLESRELKKESNLQKNISDMADYIKNDVDNVKREINNLKNERDYYKGVSGAGIGNKWINHCKEYADKHNISYRDAIKQAKSTYKK